ncbi:restriction endonuclease subunit S [Crocinitomix algicola]|uniref:restriction endonuclease subunit S n=1 Tax=Crocinitomix algicola TaxID=1740263 RepID=UPI00087225F5|nr:restriction endonuclease subunit S [Crocinitomix algicola]
MKLKSVCSIKSGKSYRRKPVFDNDGTCRLIQIKDVSKEGFIDSPMLIRCKEDDTGHFLKHGDLLFVAKGNNNYAMVFDADFSAIAISLFFVVRPDHSKVSAKYLAWYINSKPGQHYLEQHRMGAAVGNIRKSVLENMPILLPDLKTQEQISTLHQAMIKEKQLTNAYLEKKENYINQKILDLIQ